ncbi:MAG: PA domain-containing protein, partial [candidate division WOR-3 bacterium]
MKTNSKSKRLTTIALAAILVAAFSNVALSFGELKRTAAITAEEIEAHIKFLASDELAGRLAGSEGADKAADYIASEFKSYGLKPVGDDGTFKQNFSFVGGVKPGPGNMLAWSLRGSVKPLKAGEDFSPLAFSRDELVEAEVVFAGYGISAPELNYDDYAGVDVKGKIVLVLKNTPEGDQSAFQKYSSPRYKALTAKEKGARGIIFVASEEKLKDDPLALLRYDQSFGDSGIAAVVLSRHIA